MNYDEEKINFSYIHVEKSFYDWFLWWNLESQALARYRDHYKENIL
jgi:hypothetical protein